MEAGKYKATDIARWFIFRDNQSEEMQGGDKITLLKLLKLLYYAEGSFLALRDKSLFNEKIMAWEHGPVVEEVWNKYKSDPFNLPFDATDYTAVEKIEDSDLSLLEDVYNVFGQYSAWGLRNKTHEETPWLSATENGKVLGKEIDRNIMRNYFIKNYVGA